VVGPASAATVSTFRNIAGSEMATLPLLARRSNSSFAISFQANIDEVIAALGQSDRWVKPYVTASALTATAKAVRVVEQAALTASFDRPVPFTQRAVLYQSASRSDLTASIYLRDEASGGTPPSRYLAPEIDGGPRRPKSHELRLRRAGILGPSEFAVPGDDVPLDQYGNVPGGVIEQMLSQLGAAEQFAGYKANETARSRRRAGVRRTSRFFFSPGVTNSVHGHTNLPRGIFERLGSGHGAPVRSLLIFVHRAPQYRPRYRFGLAAVAEAERVFPGFWSSYFDSFVASGRILRR